MVNINTLFPLNFFKMELSKAKIITSCGVMYEEVIHMTTTAWKQGKWWVDLYSFKVSTFYINSTILMESNCEELSMYRVIPKTSI